MTNAPEKRPGVFRVQLTDSRVHVFGRIGAALAWVRWQGRRGVGVDLPPMVDHQQSTMDTRLATTTGMLLFVLALGLRMLWLDHQSLWLDEGSTWQMIQHGWVTLLWDW